MELPMGVAFTCSIDDGYPSDMKLAELLDKHDLNGTFFVPVRNREGFDVMSHAQIREVARRFEVGSHTYDHCYLDNVDFAEAHYQITEGKRELEHVLGAEIRGFCYPGGKHRQRDIEIVRDAGFRYARTVMNLCFDAGDKPFEMPTTMQFYPHGRAVYLRNFAESGHWFKRQQGLRLAFQHHDWIERLYALFEHACEHGSAFHLWAHSKEVDELDAWLQLDQFLAHVASRIAIGDRLNNEQLAARCYPAGTRQVTADCY
jgi:peptidoglycan/xylan/chitin deacetylase (PgdA/CDA1 family)